MSATEYEACLHSDEDTNINTKYHRAKAGLSAGRVILGFQGSQQRQETVTLHHSQIKLQWNRLYVYL